MARAYEAESRYEDAVKAYEESLLLDRQEEAIKGIEKNKVLLENFLKAAVLKSEAEEFILSKDYANAVSKFEESLSLYNNEVIKEKLKNMEELVTELKARALQLRREGSEHAKRGRNAEALLRFTESAKLWADNAVLELVKKYEELVPEEQRLPVRTSESLHREKNPEAARLLKEGTELYRAENYTEALIRYRKSYEIEENQQLKDWIDRIEGSLKAQASIDESNRLIREGNAYYTIGRYKEALECYMSSIELYPNKEIEDFIKHIEDIIKN
jgi:tetratricopeptide (TPR) repeat protein